MKAFNITLDIAEKNGFTPEGLKTAIINNIAEIDLSLISFEYENGTCHCVIEYKNFSPMLPYHKIVLGGISNLPTEYPYFDIREISPSFTEV